MDRVINFFKAWRQWFRPRLAGMNVYHELFADRVEKAFIADGVQYWAFKKDTDMPYGRYKYMITFIKQVDLRMTDAVLRAYLDKIENNISGQGGRDINLTKVFQTVQDMRSRLELMFETEVVLDYASVVYFDDSEDLTTYDTKHNKHKKERWREAGTLDFFYTRPSSELFGLKDISKTDLEGYLAMQKELIKDPTLEI